MQTEIKIKIEPNFGGEYSVEYDGKYITLLGIDKNQPLNQVINPSPEDSFEPVVLNPVIYEIRNAHPEIKKIDDEFIYIDLGLMKRVFIIHGWDGYPEEGWFYWLRDELQKNGFEVVVPQMPKGEPQIEEWVSFLDDLVGYTDDNTYFVGHSIGCQAILRYLQGIENKIGGVVLVAGFFDLRNLETEQEKITAKAWIETPIDFEKVKSVAGEIVCILSDNDEVVELEYNKDVFENRLHAKVIVDAGKGHFSGEDEIYELPIALEEVLRISKHESSIGESEIKKNRCYYDMDGLLADFEGAIAKGKDPKQIGFYIDLEPMPYAIESVNKLKEFYDVHVLSTPAWSKPHSWGEKRIWIEKYFGDIFFKKITLTHEKNTVGDAGDFLLDDHSWNGADKFKGEFIHVGSEKFPTLEIATEYLLEKAKEEKNKLEDVKATQIIYDMGYHQPTKKGKGLGALFSKEDLQPVIDSKNIKTEKEMLDYVKQMDNDNPVKYNETNYHDFAVSEGFDFDEKDKLWKKGNRRSSNLMFKSVGMSKVVVPRDAVVKLNIPLSKNGNGHSNNNNITMETKNGAKKDYAKLLSELKGAIRTELNLCEPSSTPTVCSMKGNAEDYQKLEEMIISHVADGGLSISQAIIEVERAYNPNMIQD